MGYGVVAGEAGLCENRFYKRNDLGN